MKRSGSVRWRQKKQIPDGNSVRSFFPSIIRLFGMALFPPKCHACGMLFQDRQKDENGPSQLLLSECEVKASSAVDIFGSLFAPYLCSRCIYAYRSVESPICVCCGKVFAARHDKDHWCESCLKQKKKFNRARAAGLYEGPLLSLIQRLKYHGRSELAEPLGKLLYHTYRKYWEIGDIDWVVPVPLHPRKRRRRGFNQADLMVAKWPRYLLREDNGNRVDIRPDILRRIRFTTSQTGLGRQARQRNIKGAFELSGGVQLQRRSILLIDDVFTTGATVTECARVMRAGGANRVDVLTLARAM
jgi:ComF family protein